MAEEVESEFASEGFEEDCFGGKWGKSEYFIFFERLVDDLE